MFSSLSGHTKLVLGNRCLMVLEYFVFGVVPLICVKKSFITKQMQREEGGWGGGGAEDWFTEGQNPNYDSAWFTKACNINEFKGLLRYQKPHVTDYIAFAYNVQYADSLYCCVYWNISYNTRCRITNFLHCVHCPCCY